MDFIDNDGGEYVNFIDDDDGGKFRRRPRNTMPLVQVPRYVSKRHIIIFLVLGCHSLFVSSYEIFVSCYEIFVSCYEIFVSCYEIFVARHS